MELPVPKKNIKMKYQSIIQSINAQLRMREDENHKLQMEVAKLWIYQKININCRSDLEYLF